MDMSVVVGPCVQVQAVLGVLVVRVEREMVKSLDAYRHERGACMEVRRPYSARSSFDAQHYAEVADEELLEHACYEVTALQAGYKAKASHTEVYNSSDGDGKIQDKMTTNYLEDSVALWVADKD